MIPKMVVIYERETKNVLAIIPLSADKEGITRTDVAFRFFGDSEPVFQNVNGELKFVENGFIVEL